MPRNSSVQSSRTAAFRALHEAGCFITPNPWDKGSAIYLERLGFKALATTSAGMAFSFGLPDTIDAVPRDLMLRHIGEIVEATSLPVNADFQTGYAKEPEDVAANVSLCLSTGVAGLSIEDASGDATTPLYDFDLSVERIRAARASIDSSGTGVMLTARCEAFLAGDPKAERTVLERLPAYADAGADCLFAPGIKSLDLVSQVVKTVAPKPVNVIVSSPMPGFTLAALADLGVRRISVGSALARTAWKAFIDAAKSISATGEFNGLGNATSFDELNLLFTKK